MRPRHGRYLFGLWLARWGFALLVGTVIAASAVVAFTVDPPDSVPPFALQAGVVYRVEVGATVFLALYLASMDMVAELSEEVQELRDRWEAGHDGR